MKSWKGDKELETWYKAFKIRALEVIKKFKLISFRKKLQFKIFEPPGPPPPAPLAARISGHFCVLYGTLGNIFLNVK